MGTDSCGEQLRELLLVAKQGVCNSIHLAAVLHSRQSVTPSYHVHHLISCVVVRAFLWLQTGLRLCARSLRAPT
jgi:hypothetical protein